MSDALAAQKQPFAVWLTPKKNQAVYLSGVIHYVCDEYSAIPFNPHLTLVSGITHDTNTLLEEAESVLRDVIPIKLSIQKISCADDFFKTLFLTFDENDSLIQIFQKFKTAITGNHTESFFPHVSLLYKKMTFEEKQKISSNLEIPIHEIMFDTVQIVCPGNRKKGWYDISRWETIFNRKLTGV